jgi:hypothetical protein
VSITTATLRVKLSSTGSRQLRRCWEIFECIISGASAPGHCENVFSDR